MASNGPKPKAGSFTSTPSTPSSGRRAIRGRSKSAAVRRLPYAERVRLARRQGHMRLAFLLLGCLGVVLLMVLAATRAHAGPTARSLRHARAVKRSSGLPFPSSSGAGLRPGPNLTPWSDPSVLPGDVLIADEGNNRLLIVSPTGKILWQFPGPRGLPPGSTFRSPDDALFTANGQDIVATEETDQVVSLISVAKERFLWRYGTPGIPGASANHLDNPDDAMMLPDSNLLLADIKNCSILLVHSGMTRPLERIGIQDSFCLHDPPYRFGSPNGAFPLTNGNYLVTEINGDWVDEINLQGQLLWSTHPPGVAYPSDTNEISPGVFLTVDYSTPGQVVEFNRTGKLLWRYGPRSGPGMLRTPSLCEPIPTNGDILCNDDGNDRVIVISPRTDRIVWQYGHTGIPGQKPGYLSGPDGVDLAPPYSMVVRHAASMGLPTLHCASGLPQGACTIFRNGG